MKSITISSGFAVLVLSIAVSPVFGEEPVQPYHYSNEWSLVSAPPPAGPYRPVNIDPRVPGPGSVEPMRMFPPRPVTEAPAATVPANQTAEEYTAESSAASVEQEISAAIPGMAPAAGIAARQDEPVAPAAAAKAMTPPSAGDTAGYADYYRNGKPGWGAMAPHQPVPGNDWRRPPPVSRNYNYPQPGYPYPPMYRGNRNLPPPGYYNPSGRGDAEEEIPPPPIYDGMYRPRPYQGAGW
jgi:hypothetical protein